MAESDARTVVAHVVVNLDIGGLERVVLNIIRNIDKNRFRSVLVCLRDGGPLLDELDRDRVHVYPLNKSDSLDYWLFMKLTRILRQEKADVVHCHNFGPLIYGSVAGRLAGARVVYTAHGKYSSARLARKRSLKLGRIDRVVTVSEDSRRVAIEQAGQDPARVETLINGVDVAEFVTRGLRDRVREQLGVAPDAPVFGIVARLTAVKDHAMLLRAFARVRAVRGDAVLLVIGDGELEDELKQSVSAGNFQGSVRMLGARRDVAQLLEAMDVFVLSSYSEGLSITLLEASASGLPIVATNTGGNPEVVADRETGLIVPVQDERAMADAMLWMIDNPQRAHAMGTAGRERVERCFSIATMVTRYEEIYSEVTGRKGRVARTRNHESVS